MNLNTKVKVRNRNRGSVSYKIDTLRVTRRWAHNGELMIPINELIELRTIPGGETLLREYLIIMDDEAVKIVFDEEEMAPEYHYTEKEVDFLLYEGKLEQLLDALDYAPQGVLNLIKKKAIEKKPDTTAKVDALNEKFKFNLNTVIANAGADDSQDVEIDKTQRRSAPLEVKPAASKYKVKTEE